MAGLERRDAIRFTVTAAHVHLERFARHAGLVASGMPARMCARRGRAAFRRRQDVVPPHPRRRYPELRARPASARR
jgi:hypothetical protein